MRHDVANTHTIVSGVHHDPSNINNVIPDVDTDVSNTHPVVSNIRRNTSKSREDTNSQNPAVSALCTMHITE